MPANLDFNQSSSDNSLSFTKIHQGDDFDDLIQDAMNASARSMHASSEKIAEDDGATVAANITHPSEYDYNFDEEDLERGSLSTGSSNGSDADAMSLASDDISVVSDCDKEPNNDDSHDSLVSHVPLVNDDESVMEMKNPAPVSQSVSTYVDQLNRREHGKSRLIKAGVFAIFIAVIVGAALTVISVTGSKDKGTGDGLVVMQSPGSPNDQNSPGANAASDEKNVLDNLFRSVEITLDGTLSLSGLVVPIDRREAVKNTLEKAIAETVSNSLTQDQTVTDVTVISIDGGGEKIRYRVLDDSSQVVVYEMTVKEKCRDCDDTILESMREALYQQVASDLIESIDTGAFTDNLHKQAKTSGNNVLLSAIAIDGDFEGHASPPTQPNNEASLALPTQPPTPQQIPEFTLPQPPPPPTPPPRPTNEATYSPVAQTTYVSTPSPTTMAPITTSPTLSPVTAAPVTKAPFTLPPVEFAPTDPPVYTAPPVEFATPKPTKRPTNKPTLRPTPR